MKKFCLYTLGLLAIVFVCQTTSIEARGHHHHHGRGPRVQVNIGAGAGYRDAYVVRRYAAPERMLRLSLMLCLFIRSFILDMWKRCTHVLL